MMEDSPYESFEPLDLPHVSTHGDEEPVSSSVPASVTQPLDLPHVSTHGDEEPVSSSVPASVTHNFPQFPKVYSREKVIPKQKQVQESNSDLGNEITVDGSLERHKARLVVKGYTQTYGVRLSGDFCSSCKNEYYEEIYMNIPPGFEENTGNKVCKLKKALYGLKQSPKAWFERFAKVMKEFGYKQSQGDHTLFIKHLATRGRLATKFEIKEQGKLKYFLGIEVAYSTQGIFISQQKYVTDLLAETGKIGCKPVSTPMDPNHKLREAKEEPMVDKRMYQRLVGRLIYLAHTWADIA
ncbi:Retrovirus-related Pol polyprotein from transposon RE1 [Vitis vinifera]|uniref:Retrovirus-related Pol polyprotein from transposon RE1 n=1 Tax=Vitis vinifera TaxID=29760 RepID=A0A438EG95_VITVI|nr:Retrovirus-related Pol polyprotein from transposon RE1 [Vitis vinifera]